MSIFTIVLAAGGSTRLGGEPKQLLKLDGITLVRRIVDEALALQAGPVIVVLGANYERIRAELADLSIIKAFNQSWHEGLASSIQVGLNALPDESIEAFLVLLTDQPYVTTDLLQQLIGTRRQTGRGIVASRYDRPDSQPEEGVNISLLGVPALFDIRYRAEFMSLKGDTGARKLIQHYAADCAAVPFPLAAIDLDTWENVNDWRKVEATGRAN